MLSNAYVRENLESSDSMAWSCAARMEGKSGNDWREAAAYCVGLPRCYGSSADSVQPVASVQKVGSGDRNSRFPDPLRATFAGFSAPQGQEHTREAALDILDTTREQYAGSLPLTPTELSTPWDRD